VCQSIRLSQVAKWTVKWSIKWAENQKTLVNEEILTRVSEKRAERDVQNRKVVFFQRIHAHSTRSCVVGLEMVISIRYDFVPQAVGAYLYNII
jgi:hypothetical protein